MSFGNGYYFWYQGLCVVSYYQQQHCLHIAFSSSLFQETIGDLVEVVNEDVDSIQRKEWQRDTTESLQSATAQLTEDTRAVSNAMAKLVNAAAQVRLCE